MSKRLGQELENPAGDHVQVVEELQLSQRSQVQALRSVLQVQAAVVVRPADSEARGAAANAGTCREIRSTNLVAVFARPVAVGSFFELAFDTNVLDLPPAFARCDRCCLLAEDEFEARFHFLQPIVIPGPGQTHRE
jgi:hypothetical protein